MDFTTILVILIVIGIGIYLYIDSEGSENSPSESQECPPGSLGDNCQYSDATNCSGNGVVDSMGNCTCNTDYGGRDCACKKNHIKSPDGQCVECGKYRVDNTHGGKAYKTSKSHNSCDNGAKWGGFWHHEIREKASNHINQECQKIGMKGHRKECGNWYQIGYCDCD